MEFIDKIIYINLDHRVDRKEQIENELNNYGLIYERHAAVFEPLNSIGCNKSHLQVLKKAKENNYKNILILEDDFMFVVSKEQFLEKISLLFSKIDFDVCMISYNLRDGEIDSNNPFLTKVKFATTASGYIVNNSMYDKLIELYEYATPILETTGEHWKYAVDQIWVQLQQTSKWYCFTERLGLQRPGIKDNGETCYVDYKC